MRPQLVEQALMGELRTVRQLVLASARIGFEDSERALFTDEAFAAAVCAPENSVEASFLRESAAIAGARMPAEEAVPLALVRTAEGCLSSVDREIHAQLSLDSPQDCKDLRKRLHEARAAVDLSDVVQRFLNGERPTRPPSVTLDLDADLRSGS